MFIHSIIYFDLLSMEVVIIDSDKREIFNFFRKPLLSIVDNLITQNGPDEF